MKFINKLEENIIGIGLLTSVLLVFANVILRYILKSSSTWIEEVVRYLIIWITFIGSAVCFRRMSHMGIDLIFSFVKGGLKKTVEIFIIIASIVFMTFMFKYGIDLVIFTRASGQITPALGVKLYMIYVGIPFGAFLSLFELVQLLFKKLKEVPAQ